MSLDTVIILVLMCLIGAYLLFLPKDFKKRTDKTPMLIRIVGLLLIVAAGAIAMSDITIQSLVATLRTIVGDSCQK